MSLKHTAIASLGLLGMCFVSRADAITLPDSGTCSSSSGTCLTITNSASEGTALQGVATGSSASVGVLGQGPYAGVIGSSASKGVFGMTNGTNGVAVVGTTGATSAIGVEGASNTYIGVYGTSTSGNGVVGSNSVTNQSAAAISAIAGSSSALAYWGNGGIQLTGSFAEKAGGGSWTAPSDNRIKKDVRSFDQGVVALMHVQPVRFRYNGLGGTTENGKEYVGVVAQDLEKILPEMVSSKMAKLRPTDAKEIAIKVVDPSDFTYLLINAVKEQQKVIEHQEARIETLERGNHVAASVMSLTGVEGLSIGLLPIGLIVATRRKKKG